MDQGDYYRSYFQYQQLLSDAAAPSNHVGPPAFFLPPQPLSDGTVSNQEGPPAFFLPLQPQPPMMGGAIDSPVASYPYYVADDGSTLLPLPQQQLAPGGGGIRAGEGGGFVSSDTTWADANDGGAGSSADQLLMFVDSPLAGSDEQQMHDGMAEHGSAAPGGTWHAADDTSMLEGGFLQQGDDELPMHGGGAWPGGYDDGPGVAWAVEENPPMLGNGQLMHGGETYDYEEWLNELLTTSEASFDPSSGLNVPQVGAYPPVIGFSPPTPTVTDDLIQPASNSSGLNADFFTTDEASFDPSSGLNQPQMGAYPPVLGFPPPATDLIQPASNLSGVNAGSPGLAHTVSAMYQQATAAPTGVPQAPQAGVEAQMSGGKAPSTVWSEEEDRALLQRFSQFGGQGSAEMYTAVIALAHPNKTARDVARRIRYLKNKKAVEQAELSGPGRPAAEQVITTGKETEGVKPKYDKYSKEAVDSKSTKEIIGDNNELIDLITETLKAGQLDVTVDLFHNVKINIDALLNKVSNLGSIMERLSSGLEDILRASSVGKDTTTPP